MTSFTDMLCIISTYVAPLALSFAATIKGGRRSLESAIKAAEAIRGTRKGPVHGMNVRKPRKTVSKACLFAAGSQVPRFYM
jgi:hypothetical protein